jgi:hypothetical protein
MLKWLGFCLVFQSNKSWFLIVHESKCYPHPCDNVGWIGSCKKMSLQMWLGWHGNATSYEKQPQTQALHGPQPLRGGTTPLPPIVYSIILRMAYIQMAFFHESPKWKSQNWDVCSLETLDIHIFLKSSLFWTWEGNKL